MQKVKRIRQDKKQLKDKHIFSNAEIVALLIPLMIEQILNSLMGTVDTIMVSNVGPAAMSAVSLVDSINILFIQAFAALAAGGCILCSQYIGKKNEEQANNSARQVLLVIFTISTIIAIICLIGNKGILKLVFGKVETDVMEAAVTYFFYTALSFPFIALYNGGAAIYRAQGNSRRPMVISVISNFINIGGNAVFIWVFHLGVAGVAIATLISRIFCAVVVLLYLRKPGQMICVNQYLKIRPDKQLIFKVLSIGVPSGVENSMFQFGKLAIQSTVSTMGTVAIAAQAMTNIMENLNGVAAVGIGIGLMTVVGQCIGAGEKEEAIYYVKKLTLLSEICMILNCLLVYALVRPVTVIGAMEPESAALCIRMVGWITIFKPLFWVLSFIPAYGMRAAGDVRFSMLVSTATMWLCRVSLCIFLVKAFGFGPMAVWIGMFTDWGIRGAIFTWRFYSKRWLEHKVIS
ncbi:MAG: MATE family efflux transporter [Lachnospiraceae bacterium]|nr:MATE family efflux transporter [Lachnospiraceae bacterium]